MRLLSLSFTFVAIATSICAAAKSGPKCAAYIEVDSNTILNTGRYTLEDGSNVFDFTMVFAANIKKNGSHVVISNGPSVQKVLDNAKTQIQPLQAKGIKVLLSLLGGGDGVGIANFASQDAAAHFAGLVKDEIQKYGLDGVDLDDEYADYGKSGTAQPNQHSIGWLITALRNEMPNKLITFYNIGPAANSLSSSNATIGSKLDYSWNAYYGSFAAPKIPGLKKSALSPAAVSFSTISSNQASSLAKRTVSDGYGAYLTYNLGAGNFSKFISAFTQPLYGQNATYHPPTSQRASTRSTKG
jgi:Glycosyl hydrolases family 18